MRTLWATIDNRACHPLLLSIRFCVLRPLRCARIPASRQSSHGDLSRLPFRSEAQRRKASAYERASASFLLRLTAFVRISVASLFSSASVTSPLTIPHLPHILRSDLQCMHLVWALFLMSLALELHYSLLLSEQASFLFPFLPSLQSSFYLLLILDSNGVGQRRRGKGQEKRTSRQAL